MMVSIRAIALPGAFLGLSFFASAQPVNQLGETARRILLRNCVACHGEQQMSGLDLRHRESMLEGGKQGPALVPGKAEDSLLFLAAAHTGELKMPPDKPPLSGPDLDALREWIEAGAPWGLMAASHVDSEPAWWSLRRPRRPPVPVTRTDDWVQNPIDAFILAKLEEKGLEKAPRADKRTLIRRASFDVTGLPPTPEEVDSFLEDSSPDAYEKLIENLLASPRYGERWARHWLDLVRYADSGGYETDEYFPNSWRYRDYVIKSFNENKPYDRFVQEQIAGDELWPDNLDLHDNYYGIAPEKLEHLEARIGTGLYTFGPEIVESLLHAPKLVHERLTDWVDTTGAVFMGLTIACARCHTHKFDPISQRDYYRLQAVFAASRPMKIPVVTKMGMFHRNESYPLMIGVDEARTAYRLYVAQVKERITGLTKSEVPPAVVKAYELTDEERTPRQRELVMPLVEALKSLEKDWEERMTPEEQAEQEKRLKALGEAVLQLPDQDFSHTVDYDGLYDLPTASVLGHRQFELIPAVHVLDRGELGNRAEQVGAAVPAVFDYLGRAMDGESPPTGTRAFQTRRHLALWLSRPDHPLTARVMVNRLWQWHFGQGIVLTPNDYGAQGEPPTHPELLDWLATEFVARGWDIKSMHRLIMASATYRMTSRYSHQHNTGVDPDNRFLWRMNRRRLEAEAMWDALHAVTGTLNLKMGGRPVLPALPEDELAGLPATFLWPVTADPAEHSRRGIYILSRRSFTFPMFRTFDRPDSSLSCPGREVTTVAPQALWFLNNGIALRQARKLAERLVAMSGDSSSSWVEKGWQIALGRPPSQDETREALELMEELSSQGTPGNDWPDTPPGLAGIGPARASALTGLCLTLFNLNEFVYID